MPVTVMKVRIVRVLVSDWRVLVLVGVRLPGRVAGVMLVSVMLVVDMAMLVIQRLVAVFMLVAFGQVKVDTDRHQNRRADQLNCDRLAEQYERQRRAQERGGREVRASPRGPQMA